MFIVPGSICCDFCPEGRFVAVNCTKQKENEYKGVTCEVCSKCAEGMQVVSPCTHFSNTVCREIEISIVIATMETATPFLPGEMIITYTALCITVPVVVFLIIGAVVYRWYMRRNIPHDPAEEPFKIMI
ncbi:hypothetical protein C0J50_23864 [Silurus asotus]|uniref:TNFR-Cys domain-containing protein n=1 Tax=Silurus asotus TaxID=30991 RepID=A0AAD5FI14_SILAS|nr:hypothetical protein C0J50_23864 [Silurus asotus]